MATTWGPSLPNTAAQLVNLDAQRTADLFAALYAAMDAVESMKEAASLFPNVARPAGTMDPRTTVEAFSCLLSKLLGKMQAIADNESYLEADHG